MPTKPKSSTKLAAKSISTKKANANEKPPKVKRGDRIIELLNRAEGVSVEELRAEFGTKPHTIRAQISIETRKRGIKTVLDNGRYRTKE